MKFSARTNWTTEENELSRMLRFVKQESAPLLDLTVSNPTKCGFHYLSEDLLAPFTHSHNLNYEPSPQGLPSAREVIADYYKRRAIPVSPGSIFITANTSEAYSFIFKLLFEAEDYLLAPQPSYPLLGYLAALHDIPLKRYALALGKSGTSRIEAPLDSRQKDPKAILTVNPNNPTGNYLYAQDLAELNFFCKNRDTAIISDEVFFDFPLEETLPKAAVSCAQNGQCLTFTLSGISKILGLPQMKLSWIVVSGPEAQVREASKRLEIISDTYLSASTPAQNALETWFSKEASIQGEIRQRIRANYKTLQTLFARSSAVRLFPVQGGWSAPLQLPSNHTDEEWACRLLKNHKVLTHPGYLYDFLEGSFLVLSLLVPEKDFREGVEKMAAFIHKESSS